MSQPEDPRIADLPEGGEVIADISEEEVAIREFGRKMAELPEGVPVPDALVQEGLTALCRLYSVKFQLGERWPPFLPGRAVPATAAMIMCTSIMRSVNVEVFELGMWQAWSGA
ncbi:MAG: hypothetical protein ACI9MJ_000629 [Alphaproteobacteria bacterium]|jgi:hypothetical protein